MLVYYEKYLIKDFFANKACKDRKIPQKKRDYIGFYLVNCLK